MRLKQYLTEDGGDMMPTEEMKRFFDKRTKKHIGYVQKNCNVIAIKYDEYSSDIKLRGKTHDKSKYSKEEYIPYVWLTWKYKMNNEGKTFEYHSEVVETAVKNATKHHIMSNRHHPEFHKNSNNMSDIDLAEMVCDWHAMSMELGGNTKQWADQNTIDFNSHNKKLIYQFIEDLN